MSVAGFLGNYAKQHTNAGRMVGKYQRYRDSRQAGPPPPSAYGPPNPPGVTTNFPQPDPLDGNVDQPQADLHGGLQEQMMAGDDTALGPEAMARGKLVTKPTIARLGEAGPEMVVPLNNKPGNHTSLAALQQMTGAKEPFIPYRYRGHR